MAMVEDSKIFVPFLPPLYRLAVVAVAIPFFKEFGLKALDEAFTDISLAEPTPSNESGKEDSEIKYDRAKKNLILIPGLLRKDVVQAAHGIYWAREFWRCDHPGIFKFNDRGDFFHWRSDGTIDTMKIAQRLVLDQNINIRQRFDIACNYCLIQSIQTLWKEMEASDHAKFAGNIMVRFWVKWLSEGSRVPWTQAAGEYLSIPYCGVPERRLSAFFPSLRPKDRQKFLVSIKSFADDDLRPCLLTLTNKEERQILHERPLRILLLYLRWPLQNLFLETVEKMWDFVDTFTYRVIMHQAFEKKFREKDFDYCELITDFWDRSPSHLKESANKDRHLRKEINLCFDEIKRKRTAVCDNEKFINSKRKSSFDTNRNNKWVRKNGRLQSSP